MMNGISSKNLHVVNYRTIYNILDPYVPQVVLLANIRLPSTFNVYYMGSEQREKNQPNKKQK